MTPNTLDLLPTALMNSYYNMTLIYHLTGVLDLIYVSFNPTKSVQISFRANTIMSYHLNEQVIPKLKSHRDLGVTISELSWRNHYSYILSKAYKTLSLIRCTITVIINTGYT